MRAIVVVLALACALAAGASAGPEAAVVAGCDGQGLSEQDLRHAREYHRLLTAEAGAVWPGWRRVPPLLQRSGRCEYLIGHPAPPRPFSRARGANVLGRPVAVAPAGTITPGPIATTWKVGRVWVAMVPARKEFQRTLDRVLGRDAVRLSDTSYVRSLVHEAFHAHQMTVTRGRPPAFASTIDEREASLLLARLDNAEARLAVEGRALAGALSASTLQAARRQALAFAGGRAARREATADPSGLGAFERRMEWMEGMARYADLRLILLAGSQGHVPTRGIRYTPAERYRRAFLGELADATPRRDGLRGRWQALGAAQAMLLDRLVAGWREATLPGRESPEELLRSALDVPAQLAGLRIARVAVGGNQLDVALAERPGQWTAGLTGVGDLRSLDGMLFAFGRDVSGAFWMQGALLPLDIAFFDAKGGLVDVQTMPLCTSSPCPEHRSPRPFRFALEALAGTLRPLPATARLVVPALRP